MGCGGGGGCGRGAGGSVLGYGESYGGVGDCFADEPGYALLEVGRDVSVGEGKDGTSDRGGRRRPGIGSKGELIKEDAQERELCRSRRKGIYSASG